MCHEKGKKRGKKLTCQSPNRFNAVKVCPGTEKRAQRGQESHSQETAKMLARS